MILIALSGRKRSGKDTVCEILKTLAAPRRVARVAFADALKEEVAALLGVTLEEIETHKARYRGILQWWGTEWRRHDNDRYWLDKARQKIEALRGSADIVVVTDARFPNEGDLIRSMGGRVVRIERGSQSLDPHPSETAMDGYDFDEFIPNRGTLEELRQQVAGLIRCA